MGRKHSATKRFPHGIDEVWGALPSALEEAGMEIRETDDATRTILAKKAKVATASISAASLGGSPHQRVEAAKTFGERIRVEVEASGDGTEVSVESKLRFGLIDWGENQRNVARILATLRAGLDEASQRP